MAGEGQPCHSGQSLTPVSPQRPHPTVMQNPLAFLPFFSVLGPLRDSFGSLNSTNLSFFLSAMDWSSLVVPLHPG